MPKISNMVGPSPAGSRWLLAKREAGWGCTDRVEAPPGHSLTLVATLPASRGGINRLAADQRAAALVHRTERLVRRDGGTQLVEVPRALRLVRLLHLEEIHRMDLAAVGADFALAEQLVVGRHGLHLGDHCLAVGVALQLGDGLEIVQHRRIDAGVDHAWIDALVALRELFGELAVGVVLIPIPGLGEREALRHRQAERLDIGEEDQERREALAALD